MKKTGANFPFEKELRGLLVRTKYSCTSPADKSEQIVLLQDMRSGVLYLAHYSHMHGHPGVTKMFSTLRRKYYWPPMSMDVYKTEQNCQAYAHKRITLRKKLLFSKAFLAMSAPAIHLFRLQPTRPSRLPPAESINILYYIMGFCVSQ